MPRALRRDLVGTASIHVPLQRGLVQRLVSYRSPKASVDDVKGMLHQVRLSPLVYVEHKGLKTMLKNDGEPWARSDVARLKIARAMLGTPPLLVLENVDAALDEDGLAMLRRQLSDYPGVVLFSSLPHIRFLKIQNSGAGRWTNSTHEPNILLGISMQTVSVRL